MARVKDFGRAHPVAVVLTVLFVVAAGAAAWVAVSTLRVEHVDVNFAVPTAPRLTADGPDETVYRIDASRSRVTYRVQENLAGVSRTAEGSTQGIAGDLALNAADPSASRIGDVVVNVQQLTSDEELRDQRLQHDFLQSADYPLATFVTTSLDGMPGSIDDGVDYEVRITGDLTVKETTAPVTLDATARRDGDALHVTASTTVSLSALDVGPISLIGFVSADDAAELTFDLVAVDAAAGDVPNAVAAPTREPTVSTGAGPSFAGTVQPVLEERCASCHNPNGVGADVWKLETAGDAAEVASGLGLVTSARFMPPWPASDASVPFQHDLSLSDDQIADLAAWADAGGPLDVDPTTPVEAADEDVPEVRADLDLHLAEPYAGSVANRNDYRCFIVDPGLTQTTFVQGYEFVPDQTEIVHHALGFRVAATKVDELRTTDAADDEPGWECYSGIGAAGASLAPSSRNSDTTQFMAWAPGQYPTVFPDGSGMRMEPGDVLVLQVHYHFAHEAPADRSGIRLEVADGDPSTLSEVEFNTYLAPAEVPCSTTESGPLCDRDAVMEQLVADYGPSAPFIANGLLAVCGTTVDDYAAMTDGIASASCEHRVRAPGKVLAIFGHMHEIGKHFTMTLNPGTPEERVLLDIPAWDFGWQLNYQPVEDIELRKGDRIKVECTWDRSLLSPALEPRYVTWAEGTEDEMCYSSITTLRPPDP